MSTWLHQRTHRCVSSAHIISEQVTVRCSSGRVGQLARISSLRELRGAKGFHYRNRSVCLRLPNCLDRTRMILSIHSRRRELSSFIRKTADLVMPHPVGIWPSGNDSDDRGPATLPLISAFCWLLQLSKRSHVLFPLDSRHSLLWYTIKCRFYEHLPPFSDVTTTHAPVTCTRPVRTSIKKSFPLCHPSQRPKLNTTANTSNHQRGALCP